MQAGAAYVLHLSLEWIHPYLFYWYPPLRNHPRKISQSIRGIRDVAQHWGQLIIFTRKPKELGRQDNERFPHERKACNCSSTWWYAGRSKCGIVWDHWFRINERYRTNGFIAPHFPTGIHWNLYTMQSDITREINKVSHHYLHGMLTV